jgi:hypothetical protein
MGTRFTKAAAPRAGGALNTASHILGSNPRKQKLTEGAGTNPARMTGGLGGLGTPRAPSDSESGYAQDTAPSKSQAAIDYPFSVGGPGFPAPRK